MQNASDGEIAMTVEEEKAKLRSHADAVIRALLNDDVPLTDEKVRKLWESSDAITGLSRTLTGRVPEAHQTEPEGTAEE